MAYYEKQGKQEAAYIPHPYIFASHASVFSTNIIEMGYVERRRYVTAPAFLRLEKCL